MPRFTTFTTSLSVRFPSTQRNCLCKGVPALSKAFGLLHEVYKWKREEWIVLVLKLLRSGYSSSEHRTCTHCVHDYLWLWLTVTYLTCIYPLSSLDSDNGLSPASASKMMRSVCIFYSSNFCSAATHYSTLIQHDLHLHNIGSANGTIGYLLQVQPNLANQKIEKGKPCLSRNLWLLFSPSSVELDVHDCNGPTTSVPLSTWHAMTKKTWKNPSHEDGESSMAMTQRICEKWWKSPITSCSHCL